MSPAIPFCRASVVCLLFLTSMAGLSGCGGPTSPTTTGFVVSCAAQVLTSVGQTTQCSAIESLSDGSTADRTASAQWSSSTPATATVSAAGLVRAVQAGSTQITATYQRLQRDVDHPGVNDHRRDSIDLSEHAELERDRRRHGRAFRRQRKRGPDDADELRRWPVELEPIRVASGRQHLLRTHLQHDRRQDRDADRLGRRAPSQRDGHAGRHRPDRHMDQHDRQPVKRPRRDADDDLDRRRGVHGHLHGPRRHEPAAHRNGEPASAAST